MGRQRKSPILREAEGDRSHAGRKNKAPAYTTAEISIPGEPDRPSSLRGRPLEIWTETVQMLTLAPGLLSRVDGPILSDFCEIRSQKEMIEQAMYAEAEMAAGKVKAKSAGAKLVARAEVMMRYQRELQRLRQREDILRRQLGLSPGARSQIKLPLVPIMSSTEMRPSGDPNEAALDAALEADGGLMRM